MANDLNLGYSFVGKDEGLTALQEKIQKNFENIDKSMASLSDRTASLADSMDKSLQQNAAMVDMFTKSMAVMQDAVMGGMQSMVKGTVVFEKAVERGTKNATQAMDGMRESMEEVGKTAEQELGDVLPDASGKGSDAFEKDSKKITLNAEDVKEGLDNIGESVGLLKRILTTAKLGTVIGAMGLGKLEGIMGGLQSGIKGTMNLTANLESRMVSSDKSARAMGAQLGFTGKELSKFSSEVFSLSDGIAVSEDAAGKAIRAYKEMSKEVLDATGLTTKTLAKLQETGLADADLIRDSTNRLVNSLGMSGKEIDQQLDSFYSFGAAVGKVDQGFTAFQESVQRAERMKMLGYTNDQIHEFQRGTAALGVGLFKTMQNSEEAAATMTMVADTLVNTRDEFGAMFAGVTKDAPGAFKDLAVLAGDAGVSLEMLGKSPDQFILGMSRIVQQQGGWDAFTKKMPAQANFVSQNMKKVFGDATPAIIGMMDKLDEGTIKAMEGARNAEVSLKKVADEAHRTGRTLDDRMVRATERLEHRFRKLARPEAYKFVSETEQAYSQFGKKLTEITKEGGPMASFVMKMSEAHQLGAMAFVPGTLRPMVALLGEAASAAVPAVTALNAFGFQVGKLLNPVTLLGGGILGIGLAFRKAEKDYVSGVEKMASSADAMGKAKDQLSSYRKALSKTEEGTAEYAKLQSKIDKQDFSIKQAEALGGHQKALEQLRKQLKGAEKDGSNYEVLQQKIAAHEQKVSEIRSKLGERAREDSKDMIKKMAEATTQRVVGFVQALPDIIKGVVDVLQSGGGGLLTALTTGLKTLFSASFDALKAIAPNLAGYLKDALVFTWQAVQKFAPMVGDAAKSVFTTVWDFATSIDPAIITRTFNWLSTTITGAFDQLRTIDWKGQFDSVIGGVQSFLSALVYGGTGENEQSAAGRVGSSIGNVFREGISLAYDISKNAVKAWFNAVFIEPISSGDLLGPLKGIGATIVGAMLLSKKVRAVVFGGIKTLMKGTIGRVLEGLFGPLTKRWKSMVSWLKRDAQQACNQLSQCGGGLAPPHMRGGAPVGAPGGRASKGKGGKLGRLARGGLGAAAGIGGLALATGAVDISGMMPAGMDSAAAQDVMGYGLMAAEVAHLTGVSSKLAPVASKLTASLGGAARAMGALGVGAAVVLDAAGPIASQWDQVNGTMGTTKLIADELALSTVKVFSLGLLDARSVGEAEANARRTEIAFNQVGGAASDMGEALADAAIKTQTGGAVSLEMGQTAEAERAAAAVKAQQDALQQVARMQFKLDNARGVGVAVAMGEKEALIEQLKSQGKISDGLAQSLMNMKDYESVQKMANSQAIFMAAQIERANKGTSDLAFSTEQIFYDMQNNTAEYQRQLTKARELLQVTAQAGTARNAAESEATKQAGLAGTAIEKNLQSYERLKNTILTSNDPKQVEIARQGIARIRAELEGQTSAYEENLRKSGLSTEEIEKRVQAMQQLKDSMALGGEAAGRVGMLTGLSKSGTKDMTKFVKEEGYEGIKSGLLPSKAEIDQAMLLVDEKQRKRLEKLRAAVVQAETEYRDKLASNTELAMTTFLALGVGTSLSTEVVRGLVENKEGITEAYKGILTGLGDVTANVPFHGVVSLKNFEEMTPEMQELVKKSIQPLTAEEFLRQYQVAEDPAVQEELKKRFQQSLIINPEEADKMKQMLGALPGEMSAESAAFLQQGAEDLQSFWTKTADGSTEALDRIRERVEKDYGNSLSTDFIIPDFERSQAAVDAFAAFAEKRIQTMSMTLEGIFSTMWDNILQDTADAVTPIFQDIAKVDSELSRLKAKSDVEAEVVMEPMTGQLTFQPEGASTDHIAAIHMPQWYAKHAGKQFAQMIALLDALISAVKAGGGTFSASSGAYSARTGKKKTGVNPPGGAVRSTGKKA